MAMFNYKPKLGKKYKKRISEARSKADAKRETPLIEKELGRELRNKPKKKKPASKRQVDALKAMLKSKDVARVPKPRQGKSVGGDVMGAIRSRAKKAGFMTGKDDMRDIKEYLISERNKKMFDDAEKKTKKKKRPTTKSGSNRVVRRGKKGDGISESALRRARKAASSIRMKKGGYTSQNKKYGGGIYPKMGK
tara:strand:- start:301 stop:879 length:579 start_codon:yes stop_codon:yes gene_type:complete